MRVFEIPKFGLEFLTVAERPAPEPGPGEALVRVRAASLNFRDLLTVQGDYNPKQSLPLIPLSDGAGEVMAVGKNVTRIKLGDRVAGIFAQKWLAGEAGPAARTTLGGPLDGMLAEQVALNEDGLVKFPEHLTFEEAATLPCAAVTAWHALVANAALKTGDTVLVQGTGGVALFALQFARISGARVIITSSEDEKLEGARQLGAADGINYMKTPEWDRRVLELTAGAGADHIIEVGGGETLAKSLNAVRAGGTISVIGILSGTTSPIDVRRILMKSVRLQGVFVGPREMFESMNRAIALHKVRPVVGRVFDFEQAREAFDFMQSGKHFGKIVIRM